MESELYLGLLYPQLILQGTWEIMTMGFMDFIKRLPNSGGNNAIPVIVDMFNKYEHLLAITHPFIAYEIAHLFLDHTYFMNCMDYYYWQR